MNRTIEDCLKRAQHTQKAFQFFYVQNCTVFWQILITLIFIICKTYREKLYV